MVLYIDPSVTTYIIQLSVPVLILGGGGLIALIIHLSDKKKRKNMSNVITYPPNNNDNFALKKDVYTKEEVEKIIDEKLKEMGRDKEGE